MTGKTYETDRADGVVVGVGFGFGLALGDGDADGVALTTSGLAGVAAAQLGDG